MTAEGVLVVNLSGGRSSGRMLRLLLDEGRFDRERDYAVFCNTGSEMPQTLDFLHEIETKWDIPLVWLEFRPTKQGYERVNYETAARNGEPFAEAMLQSHCGVIPKVIARVCTTKLKIEVHNKWSKDEGISDPIKALGYRSDEPQRKARALARKDDFRYIFPLIDAKIDMWKVVKWWRKQAFDLALPIVNGRTLHGNCDLCFLKQESVVANLIKECPVRAQKWCDLEEKLEQRRNQKDCRYWKVREQDGSAWSRCEPPDEPTDNHRQDPEGQWWIHDGRWHQITLGLPTISYRELTAQIAAGTYKPRRARPPTFYDSAHATMPCECGD